MRVAGRRGITVALGTVAVLLLVACYDDIDALPTTTNSDNAFSYVDATSYTDWVYLNLDEGTATVVPYDDEDGIPAAWTFALHRYDCKTNEGSVVETPFSEIEPLVTSLANGAYRLPDREAFVADEWGEINVDMSHMLEGYLITAPAKVNKEMGKWLDVDISEMPPIYTPSNKVYVVCTRDATYIAILFTAFTNPYYYDTKGYISFEFMFL